jgi:hypothetical protein
MGKACSTNRREEECVLVVGGKARRKEVGYRWVDNIRVDLGEVGWGEVNWIGLAQARDRCRALLNAVMNLRVP